VFVSTLEKRWIGLFYVAFFVLSYQTVTLFEDIRKIGYFVPTHKMMAGTADASWGASGERLAGYGRSAGKPLATMAFGFIDTVPHLVDNPSPVEAALKAGRLSST
jgi:hypothetical protein